MYSGKDELHLSKYFRATLNKESIFLCASWLTWLFQVGLCWLISSSHVLWEQREIYFYGLILNVRSFL